uniref:Nucleotide-binding, alpha-beta plait n=1 Tax=Tanacetum cinerariifolium TaxID=118510 RepID=A0A6L2JSQ4_TANCI|nr:nucleotide-binding, alpha-beta plait [Tanacetum cinerariifolium]
MMSDSDGGNLSDVDDFDDLDMIMQQVQSEQQQEEEAERVHSRNYIYRERLDAEVAGANNDLTVLNNSPLFDDLLDDIALVAPFESNEVTFEKGYYLADDIYPQLSSFVKSFTVENSEKNALFKQKQESARKDVEKAFGVLQGRWHIICQPARAWTVNKLRKIIRHNNPTKIRSNQQPYSYQSAALALRSDPLLITSLLSWPAAVVRNPQKRRNITMAMISAFITVDKTPYNSRTTSRDLWLSLEKAYAPHSTSKEYTLKTQLLRIDMHGDETLDAYLNCAQEYADALVAIDEPVKDKDLVMLVVSGLREEYNDLKTTIIARQSLTTFSELHALLSDHNYMLRKTRAPAPSITSSFATNYASALGFQASPIAPSGPQSFYEARPSNNNRNNNNNNRGNSNNSRGNKNNRGRGNGSQLDWAASRNTVYGTCNRCDTRANSHVTPDLEAIENSEAYYNDDALHVGNGTGLPILHIGSSKVYSPQKRFLSKTFFMY